MTQDSWARLGIAPTQDRTAIRRAYAKRLREIDQDTDPDGFMALREAFAAALRAAPAPTPVAGALSEPAPEPPAPELAAPPADLAAHRARVEAAAARFSAASHAGQTEAAVLAYQALANLGAVNAPGGVHAAALQLATLAARDSALPMARVDQILRSVGLDALGLERLKTVPEVAGLIARLNQRAAAENWYSLVLQTAENRLLSWNGFKARRRIITARYLLGTWPTKFGVSGATMAVEFHNFDQFGGWLPGRFRRPERLDVARRKRELAGFKVFRWMVLIGYTLFCIILVGIAGAVVGNNGIFLAAMIIFGINMLRRFAR